MHGCGHISCLTDVQIPLMLSYRKTLQLSGILFFEPLLELLSSDFLQHGLEAMPKKKGQVKAMKFNLNLDHGLVNCLNQYRVIYVAFDMVGSCTGGGWRGPCISTVNHKRSHNTICQRRHYGELASGICRKPEYLLPIKGGEARHFVRCTMN